MKFLLYKILALAILLNSLSIFLPYDQLKQIAPANDTITHPIVEAAKEGNITLIKELLHQGIPPDTPDWAGWTSLHWAALLLKNDVIKILLKAGANIEKIGKGGKNSGTPLMMASKKYNGNKTVKILLMYGADINGTDQYGRTALIIASRYGRVEIVKTLLNSGANIDRQSNLNSWQTALKVARDRGHQSIVDILLKAGAKQ